MFHEESKDFWGKWDNLEPNIPDELKEDFNQLMMGIILGMIPNSFSSFVGMILLGILKSLALFNFKILIRAFRLFKKGWSDEPAKYYSDVFSFLHTNNESAGFSAPENRTT
jgi:hypothetical protein